MKPDSPVTHLILILHEAGAVTDEQLEKADEIIAELRDADQRRYERHIEEREQKSSWWKRIRKWGLKHD